MCVCLCVYIPSCIYAYYIYAAVHRGQKKVFNSSELHLQEIMCSSVWVLGTDPGSAVRTTSSLNC